MSISKFRRVWLRFSKLPRLYNSATLKVPPDQQFLTELYVSLGSWPDRSLISFLDQIGAVTVPKRKGSLALITAARKVVTETFDVWDDGYGPSCKLSLIEEVLNMPRVAKKAAPVVDDIDDLEDVAPAKPVRKGKAAPKAETVKLVQGRKAKVPDEDAKPKAKREKAQLLYVAQYAPVWDELTDGKASVVVLGEKAPRGVRQNDVVDMLKARGRKKTTAQNLIDEAEFGNADGIISHMINAGVLDIVE